MVTLPLSTHAQFIFGACTVIAVALTSKMNKPFTRFLVAAGAVIISSRYMYWRLTETLAFESLQEGLLGYGMVAAELYLWFVLVLSFTQTLWPRRRQPAPLPKDIDSWPTVDVFIPTYNEPLDVVQNTVLAAKKIDYPASKLNVYLLDDGARDEMRAFAKDADVHYIARTDNAHAKAGNLNNALKQSKGDLIAIFDCDHAPTRAFLQLTAGWFLRDRKLSMLQTPHFFYSKDPFEKNLSIGDKLPNEGLLFYGVLQDGNDFWNASFFCGSCALIRRTALESIGGVAVETVTEDAHTSLKLQRNGWNTGFIRFPMAGGLATNTMADHIKQRMRWARGMVQIFRIDNPLFGPGLSVAQRICYLNAMLHFLFPLPRFVLLTAPLVFLFLGQRIIVADASSILAYALPHIVVATIAASIVQGRHRHPFWGEVHEVALSFHLLRPTLTALLFPKRGKFNVTSKAADARGSYFDATVVTAHMLALAMLIGGVLYGAFGIYSGQFSGNDADTAAVNMLWATVSILFIGVTVAVALEKPETRRQPRIEANLPTKVTLQSGHAFGACTTNISVSGAHINCSRPDQWKGDNIHVELPAGDGSITIEAKVKEWADRSMRVEFIPGAIEQQSELVRAVLGRADVWREWDNWEQGRVLTAIGRMIASIAIPLSGFFRNKKVRDTVAIVAMTGIGVAASGVALIDPAAATETNPNRTVEFAFKDFNVASPLLLEGPGAARDVKFTVRSDEIVRAAQIKLDVSYPAFFDPEAAKLQVILNNEIVHEQKIDPSIARSQEIIVEPNPYLFFQDNALVFRLVRANDPTGDSCEVVASETNRLSISHESSIIAEVSRLPVKADLANLPNPFFDPRDATTLTLPFVFSQSPSTEVVQGASAVASFWGAMASYRGVEFPVMINDLPLSNSIVFVKGDATIGDLEVRDISGPSLAIVENPRNAASRLLLVMGRDGAEVATAARTLALHSDKLKGQRANLPFNLEIAERKPYDAPNWIQTDEPVRLADIAEAGGLKSEGLRPSLLTVNFNLAPNLFVWGKDAVTLNLDIEKPSAGNLVQHASNIDVQINQQYLSSISFGDLEEGENLLTRLLRRAGAADWSLNVPTQSVYGNNNLQVFMDLKSATNENACSAPVDGPSAAIGPNSTIDFSNAYRFAKMPNLALLAQAGLPFTRMADLSETAIVLPKSYSAATLEALFKVVGAFGTHTAFPAVNLSVQTADDINSVGDKDILFIGTLVDFQHLGAIARAAPIAISRDEIEIKRRNEFAKWFGVANGDPTLDSGEPAPLMRTIIDGSIASFESPLAAKRTVVAITGDTDREIMRAAAALTSKSESENLYGGFATVMNQSVKSYDVRGSYYVGELPIMVWGRWYLAQHPIVAGFGMLFSAFFIAFGAYQLMRRRAESLEQGTERE